MTCQHERVAIELLEVIDLSCIAISSYSQWLHVWIHNGEVVRGIFVSLQVRSLSIAQDGLVVPQHVPPIVISMY